MKIGIISDTHGSFMAWEIAYNKLLCQSELIMHAGDVLYHGARNLLPDGYDTTIFAEILNKVEIPMLIAKGNCDSDIDQTVLDIPILSPYIITHLDGIKMLLIHGDKHTPEELISMAEKYNINILVRGHTHIFDIHKSNKTGLCIVNPGSPSIPKGKRIPSAGMIDTKTRKITIYDLNTMETLSQNTF